jgi:hypothetical protein
MLFSKMASQNYPDITIIRRGEGTKLIIEMFTPYMSLSKLGKRSQAFSACEIAYIWHYISAGDAR